MAATNMFDSANPIYTIRLAEEADAGELVRFFTFLGFPTNADVILAQWREWKAAGNLAFVAESAAGTITGVITLHQMTVLHRPRPVGRITALVVDTAMRGQGIGRALVAAAEEALTASGCGLLEITSNMRLVEAHAFYERLGYERTSIRLAKVLTPAY
jgi:predicted N-acetyltransferase YhbS